MDNIGKLTELHNNFRLSDYRAIKYSENLITELVQAIVDGNLQNPETIEKLTDILNEYTQIKMERQLWRDEINAYQKELITPEADISSD